MSAPVAQLAEATDSKPVQCEFESHQGHDRKNSASFLISCWVNFSLSNYRATYAPIAAIAARTPVSRVGSSTGKKRGEWFFAGLASSAAAPPKNQNMLGTSMESARWPKSSEPIKGGVSITLSSPS